MQKLVTEAAGPQHPLHDPNHPEHKQEVAKVEAAKARLERISKLFERGNVTLTELLDITEE